MIQNFTHLAVACTAFLLLLPACVGKPPCYELNGQWTTREGQDLVFMPGGDALWLTRFGSLFDTVRLRYRLDCSQAPASLDLTDFQSGPHKGKTLFGILEWPSDSSFRLRYEPGLLSSVRPQAFDPEQTLKFYRKQ